jgi:hypothetical protein
MEGDMTRFLRFHDSQYTRGKSDAIRGLSPSSDNPDYLRGFEVGRKRRSRNGVRAIYGTNSKGEQRRSEAEMFAKWGVKLFKTAKRCQLCGTRNFIRKATGECLHCSQKAKSA